MTSDRIEPCTYACGTSVPVCPHCGYQDYSWYDYRALKDDGDEAEVDCARCGRSYWVKISIDVSFETHPVKEVTK